MSRGRVNAAATVMLLGAIMPQYLLPGLVVEMRHDFAISDVALGLATGVSFAMAAIGSTTLGIRLARRDPLRGVITACLLICACCIGIATVAGSAGAIVVLMAIGGLGAGTLSPNVYEIVASGSRGASQGMALGTLSAAPQMAAFVAGLALPLVAVPFDWRLAYLAPVLIAAAAVTVIWRAVRAERHREDSAAKQVPEPPPRRLVMRTAVASSLVSAGGLGLRAFLVLAAIDAGIGPSAAAALFSLTALITILSRIGIGARSDYSSRNLWTQGSLLMLVAAAGMLVLALGTPLAIVVGAIVAGGFGWAWQSPLNLALARAHPAAPGAAIASMITGFYIGGVVGPLLVGVIVHHGGYPVAWFLCAALSVAGAAGIQLAARSVPRTAR